MHCGERASQPQCKMHCATVEDIFIRRTEMHCVKGLHSPHVKCTVCKGFTAPMRNALCARASQPPCKMHCAQGLHSPHVKYTVCKGFTAPM
jgi:hypothetical protein